MQIRNWKVFFVLPLLAASCSQDPATEPSVPKKITVSVGSDPSIEISTDGKNKAMSRTSLADDGTTITWAPGDTVMLWAMKSDGGAQFAAKPFGLWHYNADFNTAKFSADIDPMPEDTYTYYAISPRPAKQNGMQASYVIPAEQTGVFDASCDVMVAEPVKGGALQEGDNSKIVDLRFSHKIHILKIRIPENKMGMPVSALELTFPRPVAGTLTVDVADPTAAPTLSDGSNTLMLKFANPIDAGSTVFAVIAPVELTPDDRIEIKAYSDKKESYPTRMPGKNFMESHTTPIALTIPEVYRVTHIVFSLGNDGTQTLGEKVQSFTLTAPAGVDMGNGSNVRTFAVNDENQYTISYEGTFTDNLSGTELTVSYDSENAVVSNKFVIPQIIAEELNDKIPAFRVPYLLEEDFTDAVSNDWTSGWSGTDPSSSTNATQIDAAGLAGWTGARVGVQGGEEGALRISCNFLTAFWSNMVRPGRIDTAPLSGIKNPVKVKVSYTYCGNYFTGVGSGGNIRVSAGYTSKTGAINSTEGISNIVLAESSINKDFNDNNGHYNAAGKHASPAFVIGDCTSSTRLSWRVTTDRGGSMGGNGCYWIYIDNIKVSITK